MKGIRIGMVLFLMFAFITPMFGMAGADEITNDLEVSISDNTEVVVPGATARYIMNVTNSGASTALVVISPSTVPSGWSISIIPNGFDLAASGYNLVYINISTSDDGTSGAQEDITFTFTNGKAPPSAETDSIITYTTLGEYRAVDLFCFDETQDMVNGVTGNFVQYNFIVTNQGSMSDTYSILATAPTAGWEVLIHGTEGVHNDEDEITEIYVPMNGMRNFYMNVVAPDSAALNATETITVTVTSQGDDTVSDSIATVSTVRADYYDVTLALTGTNSSTIAPGGTARYTFTVTGSTLVDEAIGLKVLTVGAGLAGWTIKIVDANDTIIAYWDTAIDSRGTLPTTIADEGRMVGTKVVGSDLPLLSSQTITSTETLKSIQQVHSGQINLSAGETTTLYLDITAPTDRSIMPAGYALPVQIQAWAVADTGLERSAKGTEDTTSTAFTGSAAAAEPAAIPAWVIYTIIIVVVALISVAILMARGKKKGKYYH